MTNLKYPTGKFDKKVEKKMWDYSTYAGFVYIVSCLLEKTRRAGTSGATYNLDDRISYDADNKNQIRAFRKYTIKRHLDRDKNSKVYVIATTNNTKGITRELFNEFLTLSYT